MSGNLRWFEKTVGGWADVINRTRANGTQSIVKGMGFGSLPIATGCSVSLVSKASFIQDVTGLSGLGTQSVQIDLNTATNGPFVIFNFGASATDATAEEDWSNVQGFLLVEVDDPTEAMVEIEIVPMNDFTTMIFDGMAFNQDGTHDGYHLIPFTIRRPIVSGSDISSGVNRLRVTVKKTGGDLGADNPTVTLHAFVVAEAPSGPATICCRIDDGTQNPTTGNETLAHVQALNAQGIPVSIGMITPPVGTGTAAGNPILSPAQIRQILAAEITGRTGVTNAVFNHLTGETDDSDSWANADDGSDRITDNKKYIGNCYTSLRSQGVSDAHARTVVIPQGRMLPDDDDIWADSEFFNFASWTGRGWGTGDTAGGRPVVPQPLPHPASDNAFFWGEAVTPEAFIKNLIGTSGSTVEDLGAVGEFTPTTGSENANFIVKDDGWLAAIGKGNAARISIYWHAYNHSTAEATRMAAYLGALQSNGWIRTDNLTGVSHRATTVPSLPPPILEELG